ncbi:MAG: hypothetical protein II734_03640 [Paludibacteraceae bacterium]|nr:hypothetical protein [Paludibacteraceae bacterium]MBQ3896179.1 hypothetical protein [Paludibacteraceae bacterium]
MILFDLAIFVLIAFCVFLIKKTGRYLVEILAVLALVALVAALIIGHLF